MKYPNENFLLPRCISPYWFLTFGDPTMLPWNHYYFPSSYAYAFHNKQKFHVTSAASILQMEGAGPSLSQHQFPQPSKPADASRSAHESHTRTAEA